VGPGFFYRGPNSAILEFRIERGWWNRQTREFEGLVVEIPCGFKSRPAHHRFRSQATRPFMRAAHLDAKLPVDNS
jgi:hypothetical protein